MRLCEPNRQVSHTPHFPYVTARFPEPFHRLFCFSLSLTPYFPYDAPRFPYISPFNRVFLVEQKAADEFATKHRLQAQGQASAAPAEGAGEGGAAGVLV